MSTTIVKPTKDAKFFSNMSNARRALKKVFACTTEEANALLRTEAYEDGGRVWYSEAEVNRAANPSIAADKVTTVTVPAAPVAAPTAPATSKSRSETRNGVRRPIKGKCADVWNALDEMQATHPTAAISIHDVKALAVDKGWNLNNATIEFYGWRKFHKDVV